MYIIIYITFTRYANCLIQNIANSRLWRLQYTAKRNFNCTAITKKRLTKVERTNFNLDDFLKEVLIGNILGDIHMRRFSNTSNTRLIFRQGSKNSDYLLHLYELFKKYTLKGPSITTIVNKETEKSRNNLSFATLALPCFNDFYNLFYFENQKRVPNNISKYLTEVSLAY